MDTRVIAALLLWMLYAAALYRAWRAGRTATARARRIWFSYAAALTAFSLWGETGEQRLDRYVGDYPAALTIKYFCLIWTAYLYYHILRDVHDLQRPIDRYFLLPLVPVATGIGVCTFVVYVRWQPLPETELRYLVIGARDGVVLMYVLFCFVTYTLRLFHDEAVPAMRVKQIALVLAALCFAISTLGSIGAAALVLVDAPAERIQTVALAFQPLIYAGAFFFAVLLMPHHWLAALFRVSRWYILWRLTRLSHIVSTQVGMPATETVSPHVILDAAELELHIYRRVLSILERYPALNGDTALFQTVHATVTDNADYHCLVKELARL